MRVQDSRLWCCISKERFILERWGCRDWGFRGVVDDGGGVDQDLKNTGYNFFSFWETEVEVMGRWNTWGWRCRRMIR